MTTAHERGVSPVISVVLMVAIVVLLAATVAVAFLGFGDDLEERPPSVAQSSGDLRPQDGDDGGIVRIEHEAGDSIEASELEVAVDATDACDESARIVDLPSSYTGFAANPGYGDDNLQHDPSIVAKSSSSSPPTWDPGVLHDSTDDAFQAGSYFEFRIKGTACPLDPGDEVLVEVVHEPTNSIVIEQELTA